MFQIWNFLQNLLDYYDIIHNQQFMKVDYFLPKLQYHHYYTTLQVIIMLFVLQIRLLLLLFPPHRLRALPTVSALLSTQVRPNGVCSIQQHQYQFPPEEHQTLAQSQWR